ncbi:MAG TPA: NAD(P)-dependent oxidoreductase [Allocoleopsis sp.]
MQKLLITGLSGFLGWHIYQVVPQQKWQIYGTYFANFISLPHVNAVKINLTNFDDLKTLFQQIKPDAVIHTAAQSQPNFCQLNPHISYQINVIATANIAQICADYSIHLIFTSTDLVFDGLNPPYSEIDPTSPVNIYGEHKVLAEQEIMKYYPLAAICRMPLMFGQKTPTSQSFIQFFINILKSGQKLDLFIDEFRTPVSGFTAAKGLLLVLEKNITGLLHLGGKQPISRYEFGKILAQTLSLPEDLITPCDQEDVKMPAPRPKNVSLNSVKAFNLGYKSLDIRTELEQIKGQL